MRVLVIGTSVVPLGTGRYGGIEALCYNLVVGLQKAGHEVVVAAPIGSKVPDGVELIETTKVQEEPDRDDIAFQKVIDARPHLHVLHDFSHNHIAARSSQHGAALPAISMIWNPITYFYEKAPYNAVCISEWQKERFEKFYKQKAVVAPTGLLDTNIFKPNDSVKRTDRFLFLGKLSVEKGPDLALKYAKELDVPIDIVGGLIPSEQANRFVAWLKEQAGGDKWKVHFNVTEEEKLRFLQTCRALIYPVRQDEAHWLAGVEAWCTDTPTITYDKGAMKSIMPSSFVVPNKRVFLEKMEDVSVTEEVEAWGKVAREKYNIENCVKEYVALYEQVKNGARW